LQKENIWALVLGEWEMDVYALLYSTKKWGPHAREIGVCGYGYGWEI